MDTTNLKRFATEARIIIKDGVEKKLTSLGFNANGEPSVFPRLLQGSTLFGERQLEESFYYKWTALYDDIQSKGIREVYEEAAYTWFNRLVAIRILQKNGFIDRVLSFDREGINVPHIVSEARQGRMPEMSTEESMRLRNIIGDASMTFEQFSILIIAFCHATPLINKCFGSVNDYTELLLPDNILDEGGFIDLLNHTDFIKDEDYKSSELIGWLYQFYISERKDEVFAKKGKFEADEIPAATQIFTPNWIVKYMVQNTIGRIYLDNNPDAADKFKPKWKYLVEPSEPTPEDAIYRFSMLEDLKVADLACGSGHILNECFDLLYDLYIYDGADRDEAVECIFKNNLTGVDIDRRAYQMAKFALLIKACQKDDRFVDGHCMPNVLTMPAPRKSGVTLNDALTAFFECDITESRYDELKEAFDLMKDADSLGSIMKFDICDSTRKAIIQKINRWDSCSDIEHEIKELLPGMRLIITLTEKYSALVMNPPYMGGGNMNKVLSEYVKKNYEIGKADLATVFVQMMGQKTSEKGAYSFIIPPSWMFLSTFEGLRKLIIDNHSVNSLLHLSRGVFGADFGASSAVIKNFKDEDAKGSYFRLIERTFQEFDQKHLKMLFEQTLANHDFKYYFKDYTKDVTSLPYSEDGNKIYYERISQNNFKQIPGAPIGYWVSESFIKSMVPENKFTQYAVAKVGLSTSNNNKFLRLWTEVNFDKIGFKYTNLEQTKDCRYKYIPHPKGGGFRKWFGNLEYVVNWENNGEEIKYSVTHNPTDPKTTHWSRRIFNTEYFFKQGITWSDICSGNISMRILPAGCIFNSSAPSAFFLNDEMKLYVLSFFNSSVSMVYLKLLAPTMHFNAGPIEKVPIICNETLHLKIEKLSSGCIHISQSDWDAHETSWDFKENELISTAKSTGPITGTINGETTIQFYNLELVYNDYIAKWNNMFYQLHSNEEELNRQFIDIYGLQDELTPDVPQKDITILQQGEITFTDDNHYQWNSDVVMKQFISYAIGCMMGRYRLDKPGLNIAHTDATEEELKPYTYNGQTFEIDDDGIIPLMGDDTPFNDNASARMKEFIKIAFGTDMLSENLNFMEKSLGDNMTIAKYLQKDFWKDHKKMYQNRPIYWLFSSKRGAFKVIAYMHRMDAFTVTKIRNKYLLKQIEYLKQRIEDLHLRQAELNGMERKQLKNFEKELEECQEYDIRLHDVANQQITFDLDDGVVVNYAKFGDILEKLK